MSYRVLDAKSELEPMLHGTTLNKIANIEGAFNRAGRQLLLDIDPQETIRTQQLSTPLYDGVFDYTSPVDLKGEKVIDIFPQINRNDRVFPKTYLQNFDRNKTSPIDEFAVETTSGNKVLRISLNDTSKSICLNQVDAITGNGTWAISGTASNLAVDNQVSPSVLTFDLAVGTGFLTNSNFQAVDLTNHRNQSTIFFDIYIPNASNLTSIQIRFGSSGSNYYEKTSITTDYRGNAFQNGWNTIGVLWTSTTTTGSPTITAINYLRIGYTVSAAITKAKLDAVWSKLGSIYNITHYSKYLFKDATTGVWQETVTDDSNIINLDTDSYNLFLYQLGFLCSQQSMGKDSKDDVTIFLVKYNEGVARYKQMYKSQIQKAQQPYYTRTFNRYNLNSR